ATEYGGAYMIPSVLGQTRIMLCDSKAIAHFYARETWTYVQTPLSLALIESAIGRGLLWSQGENHRRCCSVLVLALATNRLPTNQARILNMPSVSLHNGS
ncbi:hypothetical protein EDB19DRAFT_1642776, partial [Suillus lakei]